MCLKRSVRCNQDGFELFQGYCWDSTFLVSVRGDLGSDSVPVGVADICDWVSVVPSILQGVPGVFLGAPGVFSGY